MKKYKSNRAILVLESPWSLDDDDANRSSVLPFIEGVAKFAGDIEVFHANFYDKNSFEKALSSLCKSRYSNTTIYVAAHGGEKSVGNVALEDVLHSIGWISKEFNINGVLIGACFVGKNTITIEVFMQQTNIKWCAGYSASINWLQGTLIDSSILTYMSLLDVKDFSDRKQLINSFAKALSPFSTTFPFAKDKFGRNMRLSESVEIIIQPSGKGYRAITNTKQIFDEVSDLSI